MSMTPRERWIAVLNGDSPDRVPADYWGTEEVTARLLKDLACATEDDLWRKLRVDRTHAVAPRFIGPKPEPGKDIWGVTYREQRYGENLGSYREVEHHPLAEMTDPAELENHIWPDADWFDYSEIRQDLEKLEEWPVMAGHYEPLLYYSALRGFERMLMDLSVAPEFAERVLQKIFDFLYEYTKRIFEAAGERGGILYTYVAEDLGTQNGLLIGLDMIDRFLIPRMRAMVDLAHSFGIKAFHHDDGACREVLPRMVDIGIDILNPIQWRCPGMDREGLKRDFGDAFVFHGGVDNQHTLPFGTPEDIRTEVAENIRILGADGGYIVAPCHNIQPNTPTENIVALYDAVEKYGSR